MKMIRFTSLVIVLAAFLFCAPKASAQVEIGVKVAPSFSFARTIAKEQYNLQNKGSNLNFGVGIIADYFFGANYALSSGLIFNTKGSTISFDYTADDAMGVRQTGENDINLQYLEIPVTLKLFTNEVSQGTRLYFQAGPSLNTMLAAKFDDRKVQPNGDKYTKDFNLFEISLLLGAGAEWELGQSTKLFAGLSYHRGLTDFDELYEKRFGDKKIELKNNSVAVDLGIKF
ncbi:porin family protein [Rufibacter psychrotolerans]|uniref:porin family protein n=1 Tax=Rufibacter psychrotolerans TaxID=2812556 RepID=UPI001F078D7A|nr:porin family protein [Rufibacter sp. SYSU D00308]